MVYESLPTMLFEDGWITLKFDRGGLIIVRKNADENDIQSIALTPQEASSFTQMWGMANGAIQVAFMGGSFSMPPPGERDDE